MTVALVDGMKTVKTINLRASDRTPIASLFFVPANTSGTHPGNCPDRGRSDGWDMAAAGVIVNGCVTIFGAGFVSRRRIWVSVFILIFRERRPFGRVQV